MRIPSLRKVRVRHIRRLFRNIGIAFERTAVQADKTVFVESVGSTKTGDIPCRNFYNRLSFIQRFHYITDRPISQQNQYTLEKLIVDFSLVTRPVCHAILRIDRAQAYSLVYFTGNTSLLLSLHRTQSKGKEENGSAPSPRSSIHRVSLFLQSTITGSERSLNPSHDSSTE